MRFQWLEDPRLTRIRTRSAFRATYSQTLKLLEYEVSCLRARNVIIAAGFSPSMIRNDGWPYARAVAQHPACAVYFQRGASENLVFQCDNYVSFPENLRAVALTLQSLRAVDRYGVSKLGEQYRGWLALAPADPAQTLADKSGMPVERDPGGAVSADWVRKAYRKAASIYHPDVSADQDAWLEVQQAYDDLRKEAKS